MQIHLLQEFLIQDEVKVVKENQCLAAEELLLEGKYYSPLNPSDQQVRHRLFSKVTTYRKVTSSNTSHLKTHAGFFRFLMKGIFYPYVP